MGIRAGVLVALVLGLSVGCDNGGGDDAGTIPADAGTDSGAQDSGARDGGTDAGASDAGADAGSSDAGADDGGMADGGGSDGGTTDAGGADGGTTDGGTTDGGTDAGGMTDAGMTDAGMTDAGMTDAGMTDAGPVTGMTPMAGDLVIVEVQGNPTGAGVSDEQAEYFEMLNVSGRALDLDGIWLAYRAFSGGVPDASESPSQISGSVVIAPGERALFGRSGGGFFGGASPDVTYDHFEFSNGATFSTRLRVMVPTWGGSEPPAAPDLIDEVVFDPGTFANALRGRALQFNPSTGAPTSANNDDNGNWCHTSTSSTPYFSAGTGDNYGTPGATNDCG